MRPKYFDHGRHRAGHHLHQWFEAMTATAARWACLDGKAIPGRQGAIRAMIKYFGLHPKY